MGSCLALAAAEAMGLDYAASAAVVTLLTIQNTRRATLSLALRRVLSFLVMLALTYVIYGALGYHALAFGLVLLLLVAVSYWFGWEDAIFVNAVIATHFLTGKSHSLTFVENEALLVLLGMGIAILLNTYMPDGAASIRRDIRSIEEQMQRILERLAEGLRDAERRQGSEELLEELRNHLTQGLERAFENRENTFSNHSQYYIEYMEMRKSQCQVLEALLDSSRALTELPRQAEPIALFLYEISASFHERNNVQDLVRKLEELLKGMRLEPLPKSRREFEDRAILFHMLLDLEEFLLIKRRFADQMTPEQVRIYWEEE